MEVSEEIMEIVERIRNYRIDKDLLETLKVEKGILLFVGLNELI